jgi:hypothetical protein
MESPVTDDRVLHTEPDISLTTFFGEPKEFIGRVEGFYGGHPESG